MSLDGHPKPLEPLVTSFRTTDPVFRVNVNIHILFHTQKSPNI